MKFRFTLALVFCLVLGLRAADAPATQLLKVTEKCPEYGIPITRYLWRVDAVRLNFQPPDGWNVLTSLTPQQLVIQPANLAAGFKLSLTSVIATNQLPQINGQPITLEQYLRQLTSERFPEARLLETFDLMANGDRALVFDVQTANAGGTAVNTRAIYVLAPARTLQIDLTTTGKLENYRGEMLSLLSSLRLEAGARAD